MRLRRHPDDSLALSEAKGGADSWFRCEDVLVLVDRLSFLAAQLASGRFTRSVPPLAQDERARALQRGDQRIAPAIVL